MELARARKLLGFRGAPSTGTRVPLAEPLITTAYDKETTGNYEASVVEWLFIFISTNALRNVVK